MNWTQVRTAVLAGTIALPTGLALAQTTSQQQDRGTTSSQQRAADRSQNAGAEMRQGNIQAQPASRAVQQHLAQGVRLANEEEIELAQLAQQQAQDPQVREFAEKMVREHRELIQQLDQATGRGGAQAMATDQDRNADRQADFGRSAEAGTRRDMAETGAADNTATMQRGEEMATRAQDRAEAAGDRAERAGDRTQQDVYGMADARAGAAGGSADLRTLSQIEQQFHQRKMQSMRQALSQKQGSEFDKAYMSGQVHAHQAMLDKLQTVRGYMDPDAQQVIDDGIQTTQQHLQHAKDIKQQIDRQG